MRVRMVYVIQLVHITFPFFGRKKKKKNCQLGHVFGEQTCQILPTAIFPKELQAKTTWSSASRQHFYRLYGYHSQVVLIFYSNNPRNPLYPLVSHIVDNPHHI